MQPSRSTGHRLAAAASDPSPTTEAADSEAEGSAVAGAAKQISIPVTARINVSTIRMLRFTTLLVSAAPGPGK